MPPSERTDPSAASRRHLVVPVPSGRYVQLTGVGDVPFQFAPSIGGRSSLRGFSSRRFTGDVSANAGVEFRVPVADTDQLQRAPEIVWRPTGEDRDAIVTLARTVDQNVEVLNRLMFASLDYAVIARRA